MYINFKSVIESSKFELSDMLNKIDKKWIEGTIDDEQRLDLIELARNKAISENSYANADKRFEDVYRQIDELRELYRSLSNHVIESEGGVVEPEVTDEYPEYVAPTGAHDAYYNGAKVAYNGVKYICIAPEGVAVVWNPDVYPTYWQIVEE